ncbi:hypothetical protein DIPPA_23651 [Diplonema papillatum]|nr:hypothetical protein DIPPA_23651 [Diplonema papillatum]
MEYSREVRAVFNSETIRVYQAYNRVIAGNALKAQRFVEPWKETRRTWIKPSFIWMGYRSGWGQKDVNQAVVLAIDLKRTHWEELLSMSVVHEGTAFSEGSNPVVVQWDPERCLSNEMGSDYTTKLPATRSIQVGLKFKAVPLFNNEAIVSIEDVTPLCSAVRALLQAGDVDGAVKLLPNERDYPMPDDLRARLGMDRGSRREGKTNGEAGQDRPTQC